MKKPEREPRERIITVSNFTEGLGLTEADTKVFDSIDSKEQQTTARSGITWVIACSEEILKGK